MLRSRGEDHSTGLRKYSGSVWAFRLVGDLIENCYFSLGFEFAQCSCASWLPPYSFFGFYEGGMALHI